MRLTMMMAMQAVAGPPLPAELRAVRPTPVAMPCGEPDDRGDIVVCGRARVADRLARLDEGRYAGKPVRATTRIGNVGVAAVAEQGTLPNGQTSPRAMLRLKLPF
jgi:hypothetical protein